MKLGIVIICFIGICLGSLGIAQDPPESEPDVHLWATHNRVLYSGSLQERNKIVQKRNFIREVLVARNSEDPDPQFVFKPIKWKFDCPESPPEGFLDGKGPDKIVGLVEQAFQVMNG